MRIALFAWLLVIAAVSYAQVIIHVWYLFEEKYDPVNKSTQCIYHCYEHDQQHILYSHAPKDIPCESYYMPPVFEEKEKDDYADN